MLCMIISSSVTSVIKKVVHTLNADNFLLKIMQNILTSDTNAQSYKGNIIGRILLNNLRFVQGRIFRSVRFRKIFS